MSRERVEELLLIGLGIATIGFLLPTSLPQQILTTLVVSLGLIALLVLRNIDWRVDGSNPYDWVLISGILLSLLHLVSFHAWEQTLASGFLVMLFATFYFIMAFLLFQHRWLFRTEQ